MSPRDPDSLNDTDRAFLRMIVESNAELGRSVYEVHGIVGRIDERQAGFIEAVEKRMAHHSEQIDDAVARVAAIERNMAYVRAWSAGAGVAVTALLSAICWLLSKVPAHAWDVLGK